MGSNKKLKGLSLHLLRKCLNKYILTGLFFVVWVLFFDKHNIFTQNKIKQSVEQLNEEKSSYEALLQDAIQEREDIDINKEKIAREKYLMHKENEEVFIIDQK
jgi:cell division protein FtsB